MNRDQILAIKPGRELDALVAEKVMGWANILPNREYLTGYPLNESNWSVVPDYSTDISAAWEVAEGMDKKYAFEVGRAGDYFAPDDKWKARFGMSGWAEAESAPEAICKAALLAVLVKDSIGGVVIGG